MVQGLTCTASAIVYHTVASTQPFWTATDYVSPCDEALGGEPGVQRIPNVQYDIQIDQFERGFMGEKTVDDPAVSAAKPIYEALKEDILAGKTGAGTPLRQDEIAREHGVRKMHVCEALMKLEADGFVVFRKNKGAIVRELSVQEILDLMDVRIALECMHGVGIGDPKSNPVRPH